MLHTGTPHLHYTLLLHLLLYTRLRLEHACRERGGLYSSTPIGSPGVGLGAQLGGGGASSSALPRERSFLRLSISRFFSRCCFFF